jgi:hypothetical protein
VVGLALRAEHIHLGHCARFARSADQIQHVLIVGHDLFHHKDLLTQPGNLQRLDDYIAADAELHGVEFGGLVLRGGSRLLDARSRAAKEVEVVTNFCARGIGGEQWKILCERA